LFITLDKVWPNGDPPAEDVARIFLRKPESPFSTVTIADTGEQERVWTSFGSADWSEQVDLDVTSAATRSLIIDWLRFFASHGVRIVRLDAVGYVIKKPGTSCFMVEPEIYDFLGWVTGQAGSFGLAILPEVHDTFTTHTRLSEHGLWTYDFVLPGLVLHALETGEATRLAEHLARSPKRVFTTLDSHDGIPVRPDLDGILEPAEMIELADGLERRGGNINRILSTTHANGVDIHQVNCTYYSLHRRPGHSAVRPRRAPDLLRRPARRRERSGSSRAIRRWSSDQSSRLLATRGSGCIRPTRRPPPSRAGAVAEHASSVRRNA
jgi:glycosidase